MIGRLHPRSAFILSAVFVYLSVTECEAALVTLPTSLNPGDSYRLAFVTSTTRNAASTQIADYNAFVLAAANNVPALVALGTTWTAIASTSTVDARDNTNTNPNVATGEPIFLLNDTLVANDYADLWDNSLQAPINFTEIETTRTDTAWTGTNGFGQKDQFGLYLGNVNGVEVGSAGATDGYWIGAGYTLNNNEERPLYAISGVLTAVPEPASAMLLALGGLLAFVRRGRGRHGSLLV